MLQAEWHGPDAVEKIHDLTGPIAVIVLVIAIWICALALRSPRAKAHFGLENLCARLRAIGAAIPATRASIFADTICAIPMPKIPAVKMAKATAC